MNFDRQVAQQTRDFFETTNELFASVDTQLLPASAVSLGTDRTRLVAATHARFPALAAAIDNRAAISDRFEARVRIRENAVEDLAGIKRVPLRSLDD